MGGGRSGLFPGTKGAEPQQMTLFNSQIPLRRCNTTHIVVEVEGSRLHSDGVGIGRSVQGRDKFLLTPYVCPRCKRTLSFDVNSYLLIADFRMSCRRFDDFLLLFEMTNTGQKVRRWPFRNEEENAQNYAVLAD